jgi:hypothetical protein
MPRRKDIRPMTVEQLAALHPGTLLGRLQQLRMCHDSIGACDFSPHEIKPEFIQFKDTTEWKEAFLLVKEALTKHGHIPKSNRPRKT